MSDLTEASIPLAAATKLQFDRMVALGLGQLLNEGRDLNDINQVVAIMVLIALLGYIVDGLLFRTLDSSIRHKWGMAVATAS